MKPTANIYSLDIYLFLYTHYIKMSIASASGTNGLGLLGNTGQRVHKFAIERMIAQHKDNLTEHAGEDQIEEPSIVQINEVNTVNIQQTATKPAVRVVNPPKTIANIPPKPQITRPHSHPVNKKTTDDSNVKVHVDSHTDGKNKRSVATIVIENQNNTAGESTGGGVTNTRIRKVSLSRITGPWIAGIVFVGG